MIKPGKALIIYGPRRVGKTTLLKEFLKIYKKKVYSSTGENFSLQKVLESSDFSKIIPFFSGYDLIVIDEAQKIENIGQGLKIIVDQIEGVKVIATGSSSFDLSNKVGEPLVGRQRIIKLFPLSAIELADNYGKMFLHEQLENLLIYGSYPEIITAKSYSEKKDYLMQIRDSYLLKDVLAIDKIKNSSRLLKLLKLLAFQVGNEVSFNELATQVKLDVKTVERYLDILEKAFVIKYLNSFSRNLRKEIFRKGKIYFYDNGVRNAIIENFNPLENRNDIGALWENYIVMERIKKQAYQQIYSSNYFWRTYDQKEIDLVEERDGKLFGYEIKWENKKYKEPKLWKATYSNAEFEIINRDNYLDFIT
ncbi:MAG: ATP-binding protein, partial [Patescibacteria group bacterium]|nr:ATP-binding protein [Patescibacteria group bacterium]